MKRLVLSVSAATALLAGSAYAADLPRRAAPPVFVPVPVFTWTGFYGGFNAGYAFDASNRSNSFIDNGTNPVAFRPVAGSTTATVAAFPLTVSPFRPGQTVRYGERDQGGFSGGAQIGYNYQFTPGSGFVVGIEADAQYVDFAASSRVNSVTCSGGPCAVAASFRPINGNLNSLDFYGTVRGRIGYAFNRVLVYGTGGFAYGSGDNKIEGVTFTNTTGIGNRDGFRTGYAAGGGIEYALPTDSFLNFFRSSAVTVKVEGLYVNLDQDNKGARLIGATTAFGGVLPVFDRLSRASNGTEFAVVRAGLNYKFGSY